MNIQLENSRIQLKINSNETLSVLEDNIKSEDSSIQDIQFSSIDQPPNSSLLSKSECIKNLENTPFLLTLNNEDPYVVSLSEGHSAIRQVKREDIFEPNEEAYYMYSKSIGIPDESSETLAAFLDKTYASISSDMTSTEDIKANIFNALGAFRSLPTNRWGTTKVPKLKKILERKEKQLFYLNQIKQNLDKKALRRANTLLYLGGTMMISQFSLIMGGTYLFFCWDVMEPIAYLMMTANLTAGFGYFWWTHSELDFEPLQGRFKSRIAKGIYKRNEFDYKTFKKLQRDVMEIRDLISTSV